MSGPALFQDRACPNSIKCAGTILLFSKIPKKLSHLSTRGYDNSENFFRRFSHRTRRYVQGWRASFFYHSTNLVSAGQVAVVSGDYGVYGTDRNAQCTKRIRYRLSLSLVLT